MYGMYFRHCSVEVMGSSSSEPVKESSQPEKESSQPEKESSPVKEKELDEEAIKDIIKNTYPSTDESTKKEIFCQIEDQIKELKDEVENFTQKFPKEDTVETSFDKQDVLTLRYKDLRDTTKIIDNVNEMFKGFPGANFIKDTAQKFILAMQSTDELKHAARWQSNKVVINLDDKTMGIEIHYKLIIFKAITRKGVSVPVIGTSITKDKEDTVVLVGYKAFAHVMKKAMQGPPWEKLKALDL